eukprot:SAG31_NODE_45205_length_259_cov_1.731250_1_plen_81_part_01
MGLLDTATGIVATISAMCPQWPTDRAPHAVEGSPRSALRRHARVATNPVDIVSAVVAAISATIPQWSMDRAPHAVEGSPRS